MGKKKICKKAQPRRRKKKTRKMTPATVPNSYLSLLERHKKARRAEKKRKRSFCIYRLVPVKKLRVTEAEARREMDRLHARYPTVEYLLDEVESRRRGKRRAK